MTLFHRTISKQNTRPCSKPLSIRFNFQLGSALFSSIFFWFHAIINRHQAFPIFNPPFLLFASNPSFDSSRMIPDTLNPADDSDGIRKFFNFWFNSSSNFVFHESCRWWGIWCGFVGDRLREHLLVVNEETESGGVDDHVKIRIRNLTKFSDGKENPILRGISVDILRGKIVGIIGPSGSGKSTMLRALNRLWEPPAETVFLDGHDIVDLDVLGLRRKVGMLFQIPALFEGAPISRFLLFLHI